MLNNFKSGEAVVIGRRTQLCSNANQGRTYVYMTSGRWRFSRCAMGILDVYT